MIGPNPWGIFINTNDTIYAADQTNGTIQVWLNDSSSSIKTIYTDTSYPRSLFVTVTADIYIDNGPNIGGASKWTLNATTGIPILNVCQGCHDLFIDINNNLYCSTYDLNQVFMKSLNSVSSAYTVAAGTGVAGAVSNMLDGPLGIFVDVKFDLYVADSNNDRIQRFRSGELNGTTVVGAAASGTITLSNPTGITFDADGYIFIVDKQNNRIVGSDLYGFRCLVGCFGSGGSASDQLSYPRALSFDSHGNMFVVDTSNNRIQKFGLSSNLCSKYDDFETECIDSFNIPKYMFHFIKMRFYCT
jgi:hypothetical protein